MSGADAAACRGETPSTLELQLLAIAGYREPQVRERPNRRLVPQQPVRVVEVDEKHPCAARPSSEEGRRLADQGMRDVGQGAARDLGRILERAVEERPV